MMAIATPTPKISLELPPPTVFGLPEKFQSWRPSQIDAINQFQDSDKRFVIQVLPTGSGKSLVYMANAILNGERTLVLTSTKALQDQLESDFGRMECGVAIVKGRSAYPCLLLKSYSCEWGPCRFGKSCSLKPDCEYFLAIERAKLSQIVITNYSFWIATKSSRDQSEKIGNFGLLIGDEAHDLGSKLCDALSLEILAKEADFFKLGYPQSEVEVFEWVIKTQMKLERELKNGNPGSEEYKQKYSFCQRINRFGHDSPENFVVELLEGKFTIDPLWPGKFIEKYLFSKINKVLLTSATISKRTMTILDIPEVDLDYKEYPSCFPIENRRVTHIPTARVDYKMKPEDRNEWLNRIDQIIRGRLDRKGIIHTVSYPRVQEVLRSSEFSKYMMWHNTGNLTSVVKEFKKGKPPLILVSPSVTTGYDFPGDECRYQIIVKLPFPDQRRKVDKARKEVDPQFGMTLAATGLVQACGRGVRGENDWCETLIIDDHVLWFVRNRELFPKSFLECVTKANVIPAARPMER